MDTDKLFNNNKINLREARFSRLRVSILNTLGEGIVTQPRVERAAFYPGKGVIQMNNPVRVA